jgi:putative transposase
MGILANTLRMTSAILGDSDFVDEVLGCAQEEMEKTSILHAHGVDLDQVARRVAEVLQIDSSKTWTEGNRAVTIRARSLLCYWAIKELGMTAVAVAKRVRLSEPTVLPAAERGKQLVDINGWNWGSGEGRC